MINVSASLLRDFITCPQRAFYRLNHPELAIETVEQAVGSIVHKAIESPTIRDAFTVADGLIADKNLFELVGKIHELINNYYSTFSDLVTPDDAIERWFKINYGRYNLVGKFDRIVGGNTLIDWKTSAKMPYKLNDDIQFIIYYRAFQDIYGKPPTSMLYASLGAKKVATVRVHEAVVSYVFDKLIPTVLDALSQPVEFKRGVFDSYNLCNSCNYQQACLSEFRDVVDSRNLTS